MARWCSVSIGFRVRMEAVTPSLLHLRELGIGAGLCSVGATSAEPFPEVRAELERRQTEGLHGGMQFTFRNPARSTDIRQTLPTASSLIVGAYDYQREVPERPTGTITGRVAAYSWEDYYQLLRNGLEPIAAALHEAGHRAIVVADQNNLVDRAAAHRAGLGWWGKSSNLLLPEVGSLVVLGAVVTDAVIEPDHEQPVGDGCGSCTQCLSGCPTGAIIEPGVIDARRCLAWLVQAEGMFPKQFRRSLGDRLYGCDECQDVCPPNRIRQRRPAATGADQAWIDVLELLAADDAALLARLGRWYIPNRDPDYLRRNALLVLGNAAEPTAQVVATVERYLQHPNSMLRAHAVWVAKELGIELPETLNEDPSPEVRNELVEA
jgi:epoxyqueuosine reductase